MRHFAALLVIALHFACNPEPPRAQSTPPDPVPTVPTSPTSNLDPIARLLAKHGPGVIDMHVARSPHVSFDGSEGDLVITLEHLIASPDGVAQTLGAKRVGDVPKKFMMECGENRGGDYEVEGVRYGIYTSGMCQTIRVADATPDAVRLLLGEEYVSYLGTCASKVTMICQTVEEVRLKFEPPVERAYLDVGLDPDGEEGWLRGQRDLLHLDDKVETVSYRIGTTRCTSKLPALSPPSDCGLTGTPFDPDDPCLSAETDCFARGKCATVDGACRATSPAHCAGSVGCLRHGMCRLSNGECVVSADGCKAAQDCRDSGECTAKSGKCQATKTSDCQGSAYCRRFKLCTAKRGKCVATR